jgi:RHS repeat-associated protein
MNHGGQYYFYHNDHLGTPQKMTSGNGFLAWSAKYESFGNAVLGAGSSVQNNLRFPGQYYDQETGLHYNWNRFYDPGVGRYITTDPFGLVSNIKKSENNLSLKCNTSNSGHDVKINHLYVYVLSNPINMIDTEGLQAEVLGDLDKYRCMQNCARECAAEAGKCWMKVIWPYGFPTCEVVCIAALRNPHACTLVCAAVSAYDIYKCAAEQDKCTNVDCKIKCSCN